MAGFGFKVDDRGREFRKAGRVPTLEEAGMPSEPTVAGELLSAGAAVLVAVVVVVFVTVTLAVGLLTLFVGRPLFAAGAVTFVVLHCVGAVMFPRLWSPTPPQARHRCPNCGYPLGGLDAEPDGCTVCPEYGAAWRLGARAAAGSARAP